MNTTYRIVRFNELGNLEILSTGQTKVDAEFGLVYAGLNPRKVEWKEYPIERFDPMGGGFTCIWDGVYPE